jgi:hypothetical protein
MQSSLGSGATVPLVAAGLNRLLTPIFALRSQRQLPNSGSGPPPGALRVLDTRASRGYRNRR